MFSTAARNVAKSGARYLSTGAAKAAKSQRVAMGASAVAAGIAAGVVGYKSECLKIEIDDATAKKLLSALSAGSTPTGPRYNTLLSSPPGASCKACVVECALASQTRNLFTVTWGDPTSRARVEARRSGTTRSARAPHTTGSSTSSQHNPFCPLHILAEGDKCTEGSC
jgi:hypothetical protein